MRNKKASPPLSTYILVSMCLVLVAYTLSSIYFAGKYHQTIQDSRNLNDIYSKKMDLNKFLNDIGNLALEKSSLNEKDFREKFKEEARNFISNDRDILDLKNRIEQDVYDVEINGNQIDIIFKEYKLVYKKMKSTSVWKFSYLIPWTIKLDKEIISAVYIFDISIQLYKK